MERRCDGCTKCCEGSLAADILGHKMYPGKPCFYKINGGCSIYESRPIDPCVGFKCEWLRDTDIPEHMKPDISDVILVSRTIGEELCVEMVQAGSSPISKQNIEWFHQQYYSGKFPNIYYKPDLLNSGQIIAKGSGKFMRLLFSNNSYIDEYCHV